jgi:hypothetical protein
MSMIVVNFWAKPDLDVSVNLVTVPPVTAEKATTPVFGRWVCTSAYIGKGQFGVYYVKRVPDRPCPTDEEAWLGRCEPPYNPYAFFFDTYDEKQARSSWPFMYWDHFYLNIGDSSRGAGQLHREFVPDSGSRFWWKQTG